jgi:methanogenic corrinoid protein MtbC1
MIDVLRDLRRRDAPGKHPRRAIVATLEVKGDPLPLESAATLLVAAGWRAMSLGLGCPIAEIVAAVREWSAAAVVIAMPRSSVESTRRLRRLRERLGRGAILVATGDGAPPAARGLVVAGNLAMLDAWARGRG